MTCISRIGRGRAIVAREFGPVPDLRIAVASDTFYRIVEESGYYADGFHPVPTPEEPWSIYGVVGMIDEDVQLDAIVLRSELNNIEVAV